MKSPAEARCYLIAEAGVNHNGDLALAKKLVTEAKRAGADAVKFQTFSAEKLVRRSAPKANYQLQTTDAAESQFEMLRKLELSHDAQRELFAFCQETGIEFLSTPYNFEDVDFLDELGVRAFKLASLHLVEPWFLQYTARKNKPMIVATGMGTLVEVDEAVRAIRGAGNDQITLLQCTTNYPSRIDDANLRVLQTLRAAFDLPVGYSDHTQSDVCCIAAIALGATVIEKHFTLDKTLPGPDHTSAADPAEFAALAKKIRDTELALGSREKIPCEAERINASAMRRSLVARRAIAKGEVIHEEMLTLKRPASGLAPRFFNDVIGRVATRDIAEDEPLAREMFGEK